MANQKFPEVGLRAVFELTGFVQPYRKYQTMMRDIDRITQQTAQKVRQSSSTLGVGFAASFDELQRQSKRLQGISAGISDAISRSGGGPDAFAQWQPVIQDLTSDMDSASQAFSDLGRNAQVDIAVFDQLSRSGVNVADSVRAAGGQIEINLALFDKLIRKGVDAEDAFARATKGTVGLSDQISILGRNFSVTAVGIGVFTAAIRVSVQEIKRAIESYQELSETTRTIAYQTGLAYDEASAWALAVESQGVSAATSERALTSFLSKVSDLRREQILGEESTSDFAVAMRQLKIDLENSDGSLKSTSQLLGEVEQSIQRLGPGYTAAARARDLFGYSGRFLLPLLLSEEQSLSDVADKAEQYGATLGKIDEQIYTENRQARTEAALATEGRRNEVARNFIPLQTRILNLYAQQTQKIVEQNREQRLAEEGYKKEAESLGFFRQLLLVFTADREKLIAAEKERLQLEQQTESQLKRTREEEIALADARDEALRALDKLKTEYDSKLADIEQDAARRWEEILIGRMRDARDRAVAEVRAKNDLRNAWRDKLDDIERDFAQRWEAILLGRSRDAIIRGMRELWQDQDLDRQRNESRFETIRQFREREEQLDRESKRRLEDAERDHQRKLQDIRQKFIDTATEAARRNDAVAVAQAQRQRAKEIRDEEKDYQRKREDLARDRQEREDDQKSELERALRNVEENYKKQQEALARSRDQERQIRELQYQWELDDFNAAKQEQRKAANEWYLEQRREMARQAKLDAEDRAVQYQDELDDFNRHKAQQQQDALDWYQQERDDLAENIKLTGAQLEAAYDVWARDAAAAVKEVTTAITSTIASEITRYQQYLTEAQRQQARSFYTPSGGGAVPQYTGPATTAVYNPATGFYEPPKIPQKPYGVVGGRQVGGVVHATSPTMVKMGEGGPETAVFMPQSMSSMNVNHNFGRVPVDFSGLPGGMNTQQVAGIVNEVIVQLAKGIHIGN